MGDALLVLAAVLPAIAVLVGVVLYFLNRK